jgi:hypothetical protein
MFVNKNEKFTGQSKVVLFLSLRTAVIVLNAFVKGIFKLILKKMIIFHINFIKSILKDMF